MVYGELGGFQRDYLLSKVVQDDILSNREPKAVFVDEVDSMLLYTAENTLQLSHTIAELHFIKIISLEIWSAVNAPDVNIEEMRVQACQEM